MTTLAYEGRGECVITGILREGWMCQHCRIMGGLTVTTLAYGGKGDCVITGILREGWVC